MYKSYCFPFPKAPHEVREFLTVVMPWKNCFYHPFSFSNPINDAKNRYDIRGLSKTYTPDPNKDDFTCAPMFTQTLFRDLLKVRINMEERMKSLRQMASPGILNFKESSAESAKSREYKANAISYYIVFKLLKQLFLSEKRNPNLHIDASSYKQENQKFMDLYNMLVQDGKAVTLFYGDVDTNDSKVKTKLADITGSVKSFHYFPCLKRYVQEAIDDTLISQEDKDILLKMKSRLQVLKTLIGVKQ